MSRPATRGLRLLLLCSRCGRSTGPIVARAAVTAPPGESVSLTAWLPEGAGWRMVAHPSIRNDVLVECSACVAQRVCPECSATDFHSRIVSSTVHEDVRVDALECGHEVVTVATIGDLADAERGITPTSPRCRFCAACVQAFVDAERAKRESEAQS